MIEEWTDKNGDIYRWDEETKRYLVVKKAKTASKSKSKSKKKE